MLRVVEMPTFCSDDAKIGHPGGSLNAMITTKGPCHPDCQLLHLDL